MSLHSPPPSSAFKSHYPSPSSTADTASSAAAAASGAAPSSSVSRLNRSFRGVRLRVSKEAALPKKSKASLFFSSADIRPLNISVPELPSLTSGVGSPLSPQLTSWRLDRRHIHLLYLTACVTAISASWLFFSAIPTLLAFKKSAQSLEKLLDATVEELPETMAAIRLSGMEISDLTMELSDLGQEISQGVRSSTRAVRVAEERLHRLTTMSPPVPVQNQAIIKSEKKGPVVAQTARNLREGIVKGRAVFGLIFSVIQVSWWAFNFLTSPGKKKIF